MDKDMYAFPRDSVGAPGMELIDYYAGQALAGLMANPETDMHRISVVAKRAFQAAEFMMEERNGK